VGRSKRQEVRSMNTRSSHLILSKSGGSSGSWNVDIVLFTHGIVVRGRSNNTSG